MNRDANRSNPKRAQEAFESLFPDTTQRKQAESAFVESVRCANAASPRSWNITLHGLSHVALNVGGVQVLHFSRKRAAVAVLEASLDAGVRDSLVAVAAEPPFPYRRVPGLTFYSTTAADLLERWASLRSSHEDAIRASCEHSERAPWTSSHSPGVVEYLGKALGEALPQPEYFTGDPRPHPGPRPSVEEWIEAFLNEYVAGREGQHHVLSYASQREAAVANFAALQAGRSRALAEPEWALGLLLPHVRSKGNEERGSWTHTAPAITKDAKTLFEGAKWVKPSDWPAVVEALLRFYERCLKDPDDLAAACVELEQAPAKGLQAGMVSPLLNALSPSTFCLVNVKSKKLLNYLTGERYTTRLLDYPDTNAAMLEAVQDLRAILDRPALSALSPGDRFDMLAHWLVASGRLSGDTGDTDARYWKIAPGRGGTAWDQWRAGGFVAIGWPELGDMTGISQAEFDKRSRAIVRANPKETRNGLRQAWRFLNLRVGDRVVANRGTTEVLGIGTVIGGYTFVPGDGLPHRIAVRWDDLAPRKVEKGGWRKTLIELDEEEFEEILQADKWEPPPEPVPVLMERHPDYSLATWSSETGLDLEVLNRWVRALERKKQVVFYGPPGTGKTFVAERLARHVLGQGRADGVREFVQFHPAYSYEDFIQGIRPDQSAGTSARFVLKPGLFLDFCRRAAERSGASVLIVDEINRANLSRVFGELMYLLEYRDRTIPLAGGGELRIPEQVRVIATMNTADRSIALVDHALRRRFAFLHVRPDLDLLTRFHEQRATGFDAAGLKDVLADVNKAINNAHYELGVSFFLRENLAEEIQDVWEMEVEPYLEEHFFGESESALKRFRWHEVSKRVLGR